MEFKFTDEQLMIRDTAEAFVSEVSTSAAVRSAMALPDGYSADLWQQISTEMYWQALSIPEAMDGLGLGYVELAATLEQTGRFLLCSPLVATVALAVPAIRVAATEAQQQAYLGRILAGQVATLAYAGRQTHGNAIDVRATSTDQGIHLNGISRHVLNGQSADFVVVAAREIFADGEEGVSLWFVDCDSHGVAIKALPTMDQTRRLAEMQFDNLLLTPTQRLGGIAQCQRHLLDSILDLAAIAVAAEQVGGAQQALDISVAYVKERVQFGRTIASYQAIKHKCADMMLKAESARSSLYYAACIADEFLLGTISAAALAEAASITKAYSSEAFFFNAGCGIQLHGGVGITAEYDIQLYFKRAKAL
ncbi:MAG: acyl-CoA dehydrogenase family protein, partial [Porticoccaceae bacterium]